MSKEQKILENKVDCNLLQGSSKKSDGTRNTSHGTPPGAEVFSEFSSDREERDHRSTNKTDKKKVVQVSPRNSPPELIHYLKDRHGPKRTDDNSPPQLLPEVIVTRTKLNKEKLPATDLLPFSKKGKWDVNNFPDMPPEVKQEAIRSSPKPKKKYGQKSSSADEYLKNEPLKNSVQISFVEASERNESVVEIQRRLILDLQEKQKKLRQHEKIKKTNDRIFQLPKFSVPAETTSILPSESDVSNEDKRRAVTCKSSSTDGDSVASKNEKGFNHDVEESLESLIHEPEYSSDIQDESSLVDFEDWITEEEVEDVDDELFTTPQHVSTGKEERDLIDGIEFLSFETEHDMVEFTKIELDFNGVTPHDDFVVQSDDGLDMVDDSFVYSESDTLSATPAIVPTKTKDITKIKGWRTKQFAVNDNPMLGHCSSTYGICEDDDGFGSCDVKLGEELSLDVNEDHGWDAEEQEASNIINIREKVSAENVDKTVNEELTCNSAFGMSSEKKSNPLKEDVIPNTLSPAQLKANKYPKGILKEEKDEKRYVEYSPEDEKKTRLPKPSKSFQSQVDSQTRLSMRILQKHGRKPKTLAEKRMLMELEQKRKDRRKQRKRLKRRPRRPKRNNKETLYKSNGSAIGEQSRPRVYEFRKRLNNSFTADNDSEEFSDKGECLEEVVLDESRNKEISSSNAVKSQRSKYDLDKNYCYYWYQGKPIRLAGSHKNQETEEEKLLGIEDHRVDASLYDAAIPGPDVDIDATMPKKPDLEMPTEVSTCNGTVVENNNASDSFEYSLIVNPAVGSPLVPLAVSQLDLLRSHSQYIDENWAKFSASVVVSRDWRKNPLPRNRIVLPMRISNLRKDAMLDVSHSKSSNPITKLPPSFQCSPTGLRLVRPLQPLGSDANVLSPRFGPLGSSSVRMRYPKPPTLKGIRTIPGSVRLNPIVSETKSDTSPPAVNNKPTEKQKSKKEPQLLGKRGKARISNWKAKLNNLTCSISMPINVSEIDNDVQNVVQGMVDYVVLRELCDTFIDDDPDVNEPDPLEHHVSPQRGKYKKKKALFRELSKLDVTVIDMDMHENSGETKEDSSQETCNQDYCKLGCVCGSLQVCKSLFPQHCGLVQCMFGCTCDMPASSTQDKDKSHVLSEEAILSLQNKNSRFLAKEEKEFRHTVIRAKDEMIIVGGDGTVRRKREIKLPGRYRDSYMTLGVGLNELKSSVEDVDQPRRSGRSLNTVEYITPSVGKKLVEKKLSTGKEPCNVMECQVKIEKLDLPEDRVNPLCMDHSTYTCNCFKNSETCLKGDSSCGETNSQKLDTLSLHEINNSIILKPKPGIMQVSSSPLEHKEDIVIVKSEVESCALSTERVNETRSLLKSKHKLDVLASPLKHTEVQSFNTTSSKVPVLKNESSVLAPLKQRSKLSTKPSVESSKTEIKTSPFLKLLPKPSSSKQAVIQEALNNLPLLKYSKTKSRNVAVKSTTRPPTSYAHAHDIFQHSARTALPIIDYRMRNLSQLRIRQQNENVCPLETSLSAFNNATSELCNTLMKSDTINLVPFTEIKEEVVSVPEIIPEDSSEIIGKIESVTSLSVEEFHRVESGVEIEENICSEKKSMASPKQFTVKSNLLQCAGSITTNENVRNLTAEELEILLQKSESSQQTNPESNKMDSEKSVHLLHFPLVKNLFNSGHIQLWFSKHGNGSKLIMTASKEKPGEAYVNLKDISVSKPLELPELISDILKKPDPSSVSSSGDKNDQCKTYVLLRFDGKSIEVGKAMGGINSHVQCSQDLITDNAERQNNDGLLASRTCLNKESLAFGGEILKSGEIISNGSSELSDCIKPLSVKISGSKSSSIPEPIDKQNNDTICMKLSRLPGCSKESNNSTFRKLYVTDGSFPKTTALHTKKQDFTSDTSMREISPKEEVSKISADGYVRSFDVHALKLNDGQDLSNLKHASEHISVTLENDKRNSTFPKENCKESVSKLNQLQILTGFKNAVITSKIRKIPEKQLKTSDVEGNEVKSLPVPVSDESDGSDTTVKIPLPTCKGSRWYVLSTDKKFDIMFNTSRQCSVKFEQILEAISISEKKKGTVCLPFAKSQGDSVAAGCKKPKFGIYAVSGITSQVFIGPYSHNEDSCLAFYKRLSDGRYVDAHCVEELGKGCSGMEKSKQVKKEYLDGKPKQVSGKESAIIVKDVWLCSPEEMMEEEAEENCLTKSKIVQEECLSSGMSRQGNEADSANVTSALGTPACNTREANEINSFIETPSESKNLEKLQTLIVNKRRRLSEGNLVLDRLIPTGKSNCKGPDNQSVIHVGREISFSDAEDLDIETISEDTSTLNLERTGVPLMKQNVIILPPGTKCAIQKPRFRPIQPAPPVTVRQDSEDSSLPVKLIPSVEDIGYICATYRVDGKVIFRHPIERVKVSFISLVAANQWLHRFLQSRIRYIPKQLRVTWRSVSQTYDCQGLEPFKTNVLNGNYILTVRGLFNLKEISAAEAINYGLRYGDVIRLQEKRNRRDLQEGFNKLRKLLFEGPRTPKVDLLLKARENILCLRTTGKMLEKKKMSLQLTKNNIFQRLGTLMKEMTSIDKRDTLLNMKKLLEELNTRTSVPVVELDGDSDDEGGSVNNPEQSVIDLSGSESDLEDYLSDGSEDMKNYSAERKGNDAESMKLSDNKSDDSSISISVVKDVQDSINQKEDLAHNDEVTVTCIPLTNSPEVSVKPEIDRSFGTISISRERLLPCNTSKEKVVGLNSRDNDRTNDQKNLPSSDVEMEEPDISSAMKRKRSKSVDNDVVIFGSSTKKSCSNENVSGITVSTPTPLHETTNRWRRNRTVWPYSDGPVVVDSNNDLQSAVPVVKKEPLNIEVVEVGSSLTKSPSSYPCGINIVNSNTAKCMSNFKIISGKIEPNNMNAGCSTNKGVQISKVSSEMVNKPGQSPLFMRLIKSPNQNNTDMDRGLNFLKLGSQSVKTPVKLKIHSKLQSDDGKQPSSNIGTHSKTSLKYVYSSSGGKMYVNGPSGPLPLVVATRAPSSSQDESKRTMTLTVSKPKHGSSPSIQVPNSPVKSVNSDNSTCVDALKIPVKKPSVPVAQTQAQGSATSTNLSHVDVPVVLEKKDISHSESLMKWVANNDSNDHIVPRIPVVHGNQDDTVHVVTDR